MVGKTIYTIFAGRKKYLEIHLMYLNKLLQDKLIDEIHIWMYTTNAEDIQYVQNFVETNHKYTIMYPPYPENRWWGYYYNYYLHNTNDDDIVIKSDDDIVYIDTEKFSEFIQNISSDCIWFPNIINNDVCAYYQTSFGMHSLFNYDCEEKINEIGNPAPLTGWYTEYEKSRDIHTLFLEDPSKFVVKEPTIIEYGNRISINFFAIKGSAIKNTIPIYQYRLMTNTLLGLARVYTINIRYI